MSKMKLYINKLPADIKPQELPELKYDGTEARQLASLVMSGKIAAKVAKDIGSLLGLESATRAARADRALAHKELALKILAHAKGLDVVDVTPKLTK